VVLIDGAADAVARARQLGYATVVFTNQSGVARGLFPEDKVHAVNARLDELLQDHNTHAVIDRHEYCPFHPDASIEAYRRDSELRKPKPGMILQAADRLALDLTRSWVIGDAPRDIEAGAAAGCRTILFTDARLPRSPATMVRSTVEPDYAVDSLHAAMAIIEMETRSEMPAILDTPPEPPAPADEATSAGIPATLQQAASATAAIAESAMAVPPAVTDSAAVNSAPAEAELPSAPATVVAAVDAKGINVASERLETLARQILDEIRRGHEQQHADFSITKLLAGIVQIIALAAAFIGWMRGSDMTLALLFALFLQALTIALLIMGRQR
jgi:D-glycero-D-manno-heptose 1,7-bisphosphate phosphatase